MNVVIIEDEPLMAQNLREELESLGRGINVRACLDGVAAAERYFAEHEPPDLFFSDIQLTDGLSFEIFRRLKFTTPVIFCTAYDAYALEAFRRNGIDYLLKPFDREMLLATLDRFDQLRKPAAFDAERLMELFGSRSTPEDRNVLVQRGERIIPVKINDIALLWKKDGITHALTFTGRQYVLDHPLDALEERLGKTFFRANRQYLVNRVAIREVERYFARKLVIKLNVEYAEKIVISKARAATFLAWLRKH